MALLVQGFLHKALVTCRGPVRLRKGTESARSWPEEMIEIGLSWINAVGVALWQIAGLP
ncbi:hypothetical protein MRB56_12365 [Halomonas cupida]|uniref:hypothetical protein n=1 Tax=Halomonas cupida TaxID=44933 RepID=UPI0039B6AA20